MDAPFTGKDLESLAGSVRLSIEGLAARFGDASDATVAAVHRLQHAGLGSAVLPTHATPLFFLACYDHGSVLDDLMQLARVLARCLGAASRHVKLELPRVALRLASAKLTPVGLDGSLPARLEWVKGLPAALRTDPEAGAIVEAMAKVAIDICGASSASFGVGQADDLRSTARFGAGGLPSAKKAEAAAQTVASILIALGQMPLMHSAGLVGEAVGRAARAGLGLLALRKGAESCTQQDLVLGLLAPLVCTLEAPSRSGDGTSGASGSKRESQPTVAQRIWSMADEFAVLASREQRVAAACEAGELAGVSAAELVVHCAPFVNHEWSEWSLVAPTAANASAALRIAKAAVSSSPAALDTLLPPKGGSSSAMSRVVETFAKQEAATDLRDEASSHSKGIAVLWVLARRLRSVVSSSSAARVSASAASADAAGPEHPHRARGFLPRPSSAGEDSASAQACRLGVGLHALTSAGEVGFLSAVGPPPWSGYAGQCMHLTSMVGACGLLLSDGRVPPASPDDPKDAAPVRLRGFATRLLSMARAATLPLSRAEVRCWGPAVAASRIGFAGVWAGRHTSHDILCLSANEVDERFADVECATTELVNSLACGGTADGGLASSLVHRMGAHPQLAAHLVKSAFSLLEAVQDVNPSGGTGSQAISVAMCAAVVSGFADPEFPWHLVDEPAGDDTLASMIASLVSNGCAVWAGSSASGLPSHSAALQASVYGLSVDLVGTCLAQVLKVAQAPAGPSPFFGDVAARQRGEAAARDFPPPLPLAAEAIGPVAVRMSEDTAASSGGSSSSSSSSSSSTGGGGDDSSFTADQVSTLSAFLIESCDGVMNALAEAIIPDTGRFVDRTISQCFGGVVPLLASASSAGQIVETALQLQVAAGARPGAKMEVVSNRLARAVERVAAEAWMALRPSLLDRMAASGACLMRASLMSQGAGTGAGGAAAAASSMAGAPPRENGVGANCAATDVVVEPAGEHDTWAVPLQRLSLSVGRSFGFASGSPDDDDDEMEAFDSIEHRCWSAIESRPLLGGRWTCGYDEQGYDDVDSALDY